MAEAQKVFRYVAIGPSGRRVKGAVPAPSEQAAFAQLKRDGLSPVQIRAAFNRSSDVKGPRSLSERECAELLADLAALLKAGSDLRTALSILGNRSGRPAIKKFCGALSAEISGGTAVDSAFARALPVKHAFVGALIAAGEASGDLGGGLQRASDMLASRTRLRDQLVSTLSYPAFVLISTVAAFLIILLFLVPSLAPLAEDIGGAPPLTLRVLMAASQLLRGNAGLILLILALSGTTLFVAARAGALQQALDRFLLEGPMRRTTAAIVFGGFAICLGDMLAAGAPMSQALRLAVRSVRSSPGRVRLEPVIASVREGQALSLALERVPNFPLAITRLAAVGETSGALGQMLGRAGRLEEQAALRRIEAIGRILGPAMIILLGGMIGLLMGGLLSSIQQIGDVAVQ